MMVWLLYMAATSVLAAVAALAADRALRGARRPARWVWLGAMLAAVGLPALAWLSPGAMPTMVPALPANVIALPAIGADASSSGGSFPVELVAVWTWVSTSAALLALAFLSAAALWRRRGRWRRTEVDGVRVLVSADTGPAALGVVKSAVVVPEWTLALVQPRRRMLVTHEHEHVRAKDPALQFAGLLLAVAMPWNPVLWWLLARLRLAIELDCDARVLRRETDARAYGTLLLEVGRRRSGLRYAAVGLAESPSMLERRIRMIGRPFARSRWSIAGLAVTAGVALALACEAPTPTSERQVVMPSGENQIKSIAVAPAKKGAECAPNFYLDDKRIDAAAVESLDPATIQKIEVFKGSNVALSPGAMTLDPGCAGVVRITTKADGGRYVVLKGGDEQSSVRLTPETKIPNPPPAQATVGAGPYFTPFTERPELKDKEAVAKMLEDLYPPLLRDAGISGMAQVWFYIDETGKVAKVQLKESSGYAALDQAALKAAKSMTFTPAQNKGQPVPVWVSIPIVFQTQ